MNINKTAGSLLAYRHTPTTKLNFSLIHKGKTYKKTSADFVTKPLPINGTIMKLKLRSRGASVCVYVTSGPCRVVKFG